MSRTRSLPNLDYQPIAAVRANRAQGARRLWATVQRVAAGVILSAIGLLLLLGVVVADYLLYEMCRHHTTPAEVRGWCAALPADAGPQGVQALFTARKMEWWPMAAENPRDENNYDGLFGRLNNAGSGVFGAADIVVTVRFGANGRIKSLVVEEQQAP